MLGCYLGIRGVSSCYGNPGWRRDALDQDFIDDKFESAKLLKHLPQSPSGRLGRFMDFSPVRFARSIRWIELPVRIFRRLWFWLWAFSDYGRSVTSVAAFAAVTIGVFGWLYQTYLIPGGHVTLGAELADAPFKTWYAAAMGFATLGLTDLLHAKTGWGEATMFANVMAGFMFLGMLLAVLQNKFARRS
jgi:hypothetical protein